MQKKITGAFGETLAREFLEQQGYEFIDANFVRRVGEIDLVMRTPPDGQGMSTTVFVEVRYRSSRAFGGALASIDWRKQRKIVRAANAWLQQHDCYTTPARIDVIALTPAKPFQCSNEPVWKKHHIHWLKNAIETTT